MCTPHENRRKVALGKCGPTIRTDHWYALGFTLKDKRYVDAVVGKFTGREQEKCTTS